MAARLVAFACVCALAGCTSGSPHVSATTTKHPGTSSVTTPHAPAAKMASGTDLVTGILVSWCEGSDCQRDSTARPKRYLPGDANGLLLFEASTVPERARVEVRAPGGKVLAAAPLMPGTTMAFSGHLPKGKMLVTLVADWSGREARWLFGVAGPLGSA